MLNFVENCVLAIFVEKLKFNPTVSTNFRVKIEEKTPGTFCKGLCFSINRLTFHHQIFSLFAFILKREMYVSYQKADRFVLKKR